LDADGGHTAAAAALGRPLGLMRFAPWGESDASIRSATCGRDNVTPANGDSRICGLA
jgi:hypothetical protein